MRALLVYPKYPLSFWGFKYGLEFIGKKAAQVPLGLLTVAAMLPGTWEKKLVDLNVRTLGENDLRWADCVFISAMAIQKESVREIVDRCRAMGVKIVAGGPLFTTEPDEFPEIDHLVLGEAEVTLPQFLDDLGKGAAKHIYDTREKPGLERTPVPLWELINTKDYACISVQYSRGCPFDCEFCDITALYGHKPRVKSASQFLAELDAIYGSGYRGGVFVVDDNFIGNKAKLKQEVLPALTVWMKEHGYPFWYITEVSINLADDEELMEMMGRAGFNHVFVGIETPNEESLKECNKYNNVNRDLVASVKKIQNHGMEVSGGFIVGFDSDTPSIFERQINFIQQSGIVIAMVGLLNALRGTRLFERLEQEKRLLPGFSGNNTDFSINFRPRMNLTKLIEGYRKIVGTIYAPDAFYDRIWELFKEFRPVKRKRLSDFRLYYLKAFLKAMVYMGILEKGRRHYWKFLLKTLTRYPRFLPEAITFAIYGFHFRKIFGRQPSLQVE